MRTDRQLDQTISNWLESEAPTRLPDHVLHATFERTRTSRQHVGWRALLARLSVPRFALELGSAAVVVGVVSALVLSVLGNRDGQLGPPSDPRGPFLGVWISTSDLDGGTQRMTVQQAAGGGVDVVVTDTIATVCALTSSTMTGSGAIEDTRLVIPAPDYRCDDGSEPETADGEPLNDVLRNLTYAHDPATDTLTEGTGLWVRENASAATVEPGATRRPPLSGQMWPQTTAEEVREAQELADAGDPGYSWQIDAQLASEDPWARLRDTEISARFLRDVLGWEQFLFNSFQGSDGDGNQDGVLRDSVYLRCAPTGVNPLYPAAASGRPDELGAERCGPTIDELRYETVSLDLAQPGKRGPRGIWVVNGWRMLAPFAQADPVAVEAQATERLEEFLTARIAGEGAEEHVLVDEGVELPLLYTTTSGAPYERYEFDLVDGPRWPYADMTFSVRLFAEDDATVVEQELIWIPDSNGLWLDLNSTTENGEPVAISFTSGDGEITATTPSTWRSYWPGSNAELDPDVWFGLLWNDSEPYYESREHIGLVDPVAYDAWCAQNGGSPLLAAPADADAIVQQIIADPSFETTGPVAARVGGVDALTIDVALAAGGEVCGVEMIEISRWIHALEPGLRLRLYLVDLPEGMSVETLAITVVAPEARFVEFIEETAPIIESIEFDGP